MGIRIHVWKCHARLETVVLLHNLINYRGRLGLALWSMYPFECLSCTYGRLCGAVDRKSIFSVV